MEHETKDSAGVIAPPPIIFLLGLIIGGIAQWNYPVNFIGKGFEMILWIPGAALIIAGLAAIVHVDRKMRRADTNIKPWKPTRAILTDGIYSKTRNPIYLALAVIYLGITLVFNAVWFLPLLVPVLIVIHFGVILREEKYLQTKFGEEYLAYKRNVRRWI